MAAVKAPFSVRLQVGLDGLRRYISSPLRVLLIVFYSFLGLALITSLLEIDLIYNLATLRGIPLSFKLEAISSALFSLDSYPLANRITMLVMALLLGLVFALTTSIQISKSKQKSRAGGFGALFGIVGSGCVACGTSLFAPLFTAVGITTTSAALNFAVGLNLIGITLLLYSALRLCIVYANISAKNSSTIASNKSQ